MFRWVPWWKMHFPGVCTSGQPVGHASKAFHLVNDYNECSDRLVVDFHNSSDMRSARPCGICGCRGLLLLAAGGCLPSLLSHWLFWCSFTLYLPSQSHLDRRAAGVHKDSRMGSCKISKLLSLWQDNHRWFNGWRSMFQRSSSGSWSRCQRLRWHSGRWAF